VVGLMTGVVLAAYSILCISSRPYFIAWLAVADCSIAQSRCGITDVTDLMARCWFA
jgi:hypothetical protein